MCIYIYIYMKRTWKEASTFFFGGSINSDSTNPGSDCHLEWCSCLSLDLCLQNDDLLRSPKASRRLHC